MKLIITTLSFMFAFQLAIAQTPTGDKTNLENLQQQGQLFTVNIVPGDKLTTIKIVGKKAATIKFDKLKIEATMYVGGQEKTLSFQKDKNIFSTTEKISGDLKLKILGEKPDQSETFQFKLKNP